MSKLLKLMCLNNVKTDEEIFQDKDKEGNITAIKYYTDDSWSGTEHIYSCDEKYGVLVYHYVNDSPEQAGGWRPGAVYYNSKPWDISSIADRCTFIIYQNKVYVVEWDGYYLSDDKNLIKVTEAICTQEPVPEFVTELQIEVADKNAFNTWSIEDIRSYVVKALDEHRVVARKLSFS